MPRESEASERDCLLPNGEIVHACGYARIAFAIGIGEAVSIREEILDRVEHGLAVFVTHRGRRLRELRAQGVFAAMEEFLGFAAIPFVIIKNREILDRVAGARMIWAEDFFADCERAEKKRLGFLRLVLREVDFGERVGSQGEIG